MYILEVNVGVTVGCGGGGGFDGEVLGVEYILVRLNNPDLTLLPNRGIIFIMIQKKFKRNNKFSDVD